MDKNVFTIVTPDLENAPERYVLLISKGTPFGGGNSHYAFAVERLEPVMDGRKQVVAYDAIDSKGDTVVSFPVGIVYSLVKKTLVVQETGLDVAKRHKAEDDEFEREMAPPKGDTAEAIAAGSEEPRGYKYL